MTDEQMRSLKASARETLSEIDMSKPLTANAYMMLGASLAIIDHDKHGGATESVLPADDSPTEHDIDDELSGAEKYLKRYADTLDTDYLQMSFDETTHAMKFIKAMPDGEEKRGYMARHDGIVERIKAYGMTVSGR